MTGLSVGLSSQRSPNSAEVLALETVGLRELRQNATAIINRVVDSGTPVVVTSRGQEKVVISPIRRSRIQQLLDSGEASPSRGSLTERDWNEYWALIAGADEQPSILDALLEMRAEEDF